jgi:hypothetical protein
MDWPREYCPKPFRDQPLSTLKTPKPVKPVIAVFSSLGDRIGLMAARLEELFGVIDYISAELVFDHTEYYREEMGWPLVMRIFSLESLMDPGDLVDVKLTCVKWEIDCTEQGRRLVNLDPGYISAERFVLATGKNQAHRLYLGQGVWGDLTLVYQSGGFKTLPWTYANYGSEPVLGILTDIRKKYLEQLRNKTRGDYVA